MKRKLLLFTALLFTLLLAACGGDDAETETEETNMLEGVEISEEELADEAALVLTINDQEITGDKFNSVYTQVKNLRHMTGQDVEDLDAIKEETITVITSRELMIQDAKDNGIEVGEEEVQQEIDQMIEVNGDDALEAMLAAYEMSEEEFRTILMEDLLMAHYVGEAFEVEVTDEEVEEQFKQLEEEYGEEIGELEENEPIIRKQLTEQKQNELIESRLTELEENAEIEILI